jgi:hypothetical protein
MPPLPRQDYSRKDIVAALASFALSHLSSLLARVP